MKRANRPCWPRRKVRVNTKSPIKKGLLGSARNDDCEFPSEVHRNVNEKIFTEETDEVLRSNRYEITEKDNVKGLIYGDSSTWETYQQPQRYEAANNMRYTSNSRSTFEPDSDDEDREASLCLNRLKITENDNVKNLIYGNPLADETVANPQPAIRKHLSKEITSKIGSRWETRQNKESCTSHKVQKVASFVENNTDESLRANRNACLGGSSMKDILYTNVSKGYDQEIYSRNNRSMEEISVGRETNDRNPSSRKNRQKKSNDERITSKTNPGGKIKSNEGVKKNDDQFDFLRANRSACLDGTSMKDIMCSAPASTLEKEDIYKRPGHDFHRERIQGTSCETEYKSLRQNRESCLGGGSMKNIMKDPPINAQNIRNLKPKQTPTRYDADEGQYESLRANRTACLGGASIRDIMHRDPSPIERGMHKRRGQNIIKKAEVPGVKADQHNQYQSLQANRAASLGGANMKEVMSRDSKARDIQKCYKRPENIIKKERTGVAVKDDALQRNRMKILNNSTFIYGTAPTRKGPMNRKKLPNRSDKSTVDANNCATSQTKQNSQQNDELRSNRIKAMGGRAMENIIYRKTMNENPPVPNVDKKNRSRNEPIQTKVQPIEGRKTSCDAHQDKTRTQGSAKTTVNRETSGRKKRIVSSKKKPIVKPSGYKPQTKQNPLIRPNNATIQKNGPPASNVRTMRNSERDNIKHANGSQDNFRSGEESLGTSSTGILANSDTEQYKYEELRANRVAGIGGETMRFLIYGRGSSFDDDKDADRRVSKNYPSEWVER